MNVLSHRSLARCLLLVAVLSGCSSQPKIADPDRQTLEEEVSNEPASLPELTNAVDVDVEWRRSLGKGPVGSFSRLQPAVVDGTVYAADTQGHVYALDLDDGDEQWSITLDDSILGGVVHADGQLFITTRGGFLYALSATDGATVWSSALSSESPATVGIDDLRVYVHTVDGRISAYDRTNGNVLWSYESALPVLTVRGTGAPKVQESQVLVGLPTGKVVSLDGKLGVPRWQVRLAVPDGRSELERLIDVDGEVLLDDTGTIYAASYHGTLAAISPDGQVRWREESSTYTRPEMALGNVYLTLDDDSIQAYDQFSGSKVWKQDGLLYRELGRVQAYKTWLLVGDAQGFVHVINQVDGDVVGRIRLRPKPLYMSFPHQPEANNWRPFRGKDFGIRAHMQATEQGVLVYTNVGELVLLSVSDS